MKKTSLDNFSRPRNSGIIAVELNEDDDLVGVAITDGQRDVMLFASNGKSIRFKEADVRPMGRNAAGVRGIQLAKGETGHRSGHRGRRRRAHCHGKWLWQAHARQRLPRAGSRRPGRNLHPDHQRNGKVVGAIQVAVDAEIMLISNGGTLVRTPASDISVIGRNTQGVRLIRLDDGETAGGHRSHRGRRRRDGGAE